MVKYPAVTVKLTEEDGNAFNLIGLTRRALKKSKIPDAEIKEFVNGAFKSGSYDNLLQYIMSWVEVE